MDDRRDGWVLESLGQLLAEGIATEIKDYSGHLAHSYDYTHGDKQDDLALYLELAGTPARRVLELGAGTGRVALALAAVGHDVVALDSSRDMLAVLRQ